jgi:hypothetical protein
MHIQPLSDQSSTEILFDSFLIENFQSFDELMEVYRLYQRQNPGKTIILTLDDLGQAAYTCTHATMSQGLDDTDGYDLSGLDAACFEDGEHLGYLSTPSEFFIRKENFFKQAAGIDFSAACERGLAIDEGEIAMLAAINRSPLEFLDKQVMLMVVPVEKPYEGICGFPNGYFSSDLNPFENYALAKHLLEKYNLALFGIGASLLGFVGSAPLDGHTAKALMADLSELYDTTEAALGKLLPAIQGKHCLFLKYIEHLGG